MSRIEQDADVPRHRRKAGRKRWAVEVKWGRPMFGWGRDWTWSGKYEDERGAVAGFEAAKKQLRNSEVRIVDPDGVVHSRWTRAQPTGGGER